MNEGDVDQQAPQHQEEQVGLERDAIGEGAANQRRRDDGEHQLEEEERQEGHCGRVHVIGCDAHPSQSNPVQVADDAPHIAAVREAEAHEHPNDGHDAHGDEALHHDRQHVSMPNESTIEERQARGHEEDECGTEEDESGVCGIHACSPLNSSESYTPVEWMRANHRCGTATVARGCVLVNRSHEHRQPQEFRAACYTECGAAW